MNHLVQDGRTIEVGHVKDTSINCCQVTQVISIYASNSQEDQNNFFLILLVVNIILFALDSIQSKKPS
jgi:hypothetical protein